MKKRRLLMCVTALLMIVVILAGAMPALATPPDRATFPDSGSFTLAQCDGFDVIDEFSGWYTLAYFYDKNGDLEQITYHATMHDRIYNSDTGFEVRSTFAFNQAFDPYTSESFIRGAAFEVTVPGYGPVYFDAGLGIFVDGNEIKFVGKYVADTELLCEAMNQT